MEKYLYEFLTVFFGVIAAFGLNNWNDRRKRKKSEVNILKEIINGLNKDLEDININLKGHQTGLNAAEYFLHLINGHPVETHKIDKNYIALLRDFISIFNDSAYTSLKSKGLETIEDDRLREKIISLYEYNYSCLKKLEEEYEAMQFHKRYFKQFCDILIPYFVYDDDGNLSNLNLPLSLSSTDKNLLYTLLSQIKYNRNYIISDYREVRKKIKSLKTAIQLHLDA